ncbi:hypothetical protein ABZV92_19710 [Streptomyces rubiginosohelvolus]|uniref:hypothetical protein n=1 Tax=Streptomyces rubiginosohelvolus TaxID=67362 RepID=UPI0033B4F04C
MTSAAITLAAEAYDLHEVYAQSSRSLSNDLVAKLCEMETFAAEHGHGETGEQSVVHLRAATTALASVSAGSDAERPGLRRTASTMTLSAILAFEVALRTAVGGR